MRFLKFAIALGVIVASVQILPAYYNSARFDEFVKKQIRQRQPKNELKHSLLQKAGEYSLVVRDENINISSFGDVLRVDVDYKVPVSLLVYTHDMRFHAISARFTE